MKKRNGFFIGIICILVSVFTGFGCTSNTILSFTNAYNGNASASPGYVETCTYDVTFSKNNDYIEGDSITLPNGFTYEFKNGVYTTELKVLGAIDSGISSDILQKLEGKSVIYYKTRLDLTLNYTLNGESKSNQDFIQNEVYMTLSETSFAPIYSKHSSKTSAIFIGSSSVNVNVLENEYQTQYSLTGLTCTGVKKYSNYVESIEEDISLDKTAEFRTYIDNAELLFCMRNLTSTNTTFISTFVQGYNEPKPLYVNKVATTNMNVNFSVNGSNFSTLDVNQYSFNVGVQNQSGRQKFVFVESADSAENSSVSTNKSVMTKYVEPVIEYNSLRCLGSLVFDLTSVVTNA